MSIFTTKFSNARFQTKSGVRLQKKLVTKKAEEDCPAYLASAVLELQRRGEKPSKAWLDLVGSWMANEAFASSLAVFREENANLFFRSFTPELKAACRKAKRLYDI